MTEQELKEKYRKTLIIKKSPVDTRTLKASEVLREVVLPVKTENILLELPVKDQGELPICAGCAGSEDQELMDVRDVGLNEWLSAMFLYNSRENIYQDGMDNLDLMKIRQKKGTCLEKLYPIGSTEEPSSEAMVDALNHRIGPYIRVDTLETLKIILASGRSSIVAVPVYNFTGRMWYKYPGEEFLGGHDMKAVDYNDETRKILIKNSWGRDYEKNGYTEMDYDDFDLAWEWWAAADLPSIKPGPNPDPEPEPDPEEKSWFRRNLWWISTIAIIIAFTVFILIKKN